MKKMSDKHKIIAYVLHKEMGYRQSKIAELMEVSQSTIANACKEMAFRVEINNLEKELQEARATIQAIGWEQPPVFFLE